MENKVSIQIFENEGLPSVSAKQLHEALEVKSRFSSWFHRMSGYGFQEEIDYKRVSQKKITLGGLQECVDYNLSIPMAKEICMLQRSEKGKAFRQYFLEIERAWNAPEKVFARAVLLSQQIIDDLKHDIGILEREQQEKTQKIEEMKPKVRYVDLVLQSEELVVMTQIAKDYGMSANAMNQILNRLRIQYKSHGQWVLFSEYQNNGYAQSVTFMIQHKNGSVEAKMHTQWTQKGRLFLYEELKKIGYLPVIEKEYGEESL